MHRLSIVLVPYLSRKRINPMCQLAARYFTRGTRRGGILLFGEISMGQGDVMPCCREALLQLFGDHH
jgi:hypothetical protein